MVEDARLEEVKRRESAYAPAIREELARSGNTGIDVRHVEGFLRLQFGVLDHLDRATFRAEVLLPVACIEEGGIERAERLAESYGL